MYGLVFHMFTPHTRAMGLFSDVIWRDLSVTKVRGTADSPMKGEIHPIPAVILLVVSTIVNTTHVFGPLRLFVGLESLVQGWA